MRGQLGKIKEEALRQIESSGALEGLNDIRASYLGKKGELTDLSKSMRDIAPRDRPRVGQMVNDVGGFIGGRLEEVKTALARRAREEQLRREVIDVTLPARKNDVGHSHPSTIALEEIERIFVGMGYEVVEGPEMEYDRYNFGKLDIPKGHPVKDEQDTFYISENILLHSQISPVQVRIMEKDRFPIRMIVLGHVSHSNEVDATHSSSLYQIEGLVIDRNITFADLKGTLAEFARELFGSETRVKFHPHHFPFIGPNAEMDVTCFKCGGSGCRFCEGSGWIETLGCGIVHPHVLEMYDINPDEYSGFAFGVRLERIALPKCEIDDIRLLYKNDIRFLKRF